MPCRVHTKGSRFAEEPVSPQPGGRLSPGYALAAKNAPISDTGRRCWVSSGARCPPDQDEPTVGDRGGHLLGSATGAMWSESPRRISTGAPIWPSRLVQSNLVVASCWALIAWRGCR